MAGCSRRLFRASFLAFLLCHVARAWGAACREITLPRLLRNALPQSQLPPLNTVGVPTHVQCAQLCLFLPSCASFTFFKVNDTCHLYYDDVTMEAEEGSPDVSTLSGNRSSIPQALAGSCLGRTCPHGYVCLQRGGHGTFCRPVFNSMVRLVNGSSPIEGRVEVFYDGQWGTICNDFFDMNEVEVLCRMLGLPFSSSRSVIWSSAQFRQGTGAILLDDVGCGGWESSVFLCSFKRPIGNTNCQHNEDVAIRCVA